jgi:hypothetical protein
VLLAPGRWELSLKPPPGHYVSGFSGPAISSNPAAAKSRPDGWNEANFLQSFGLVRFSLADGPGSLHGLVKSGSDLVVGAPVYLEAYDAAARKRLTDLRTTRTDLTGTYRFDDLAPGLYRVLATFEYQNPDSAAMGLAGARPAEIEAHATLQADLDLYGER